MNRGQQKKTGGSEAGRSWKKRGYRKYLDDYKLVGKSFVYMGPHYVLAAGARARKSYSTATTALSCVSLALCLSLGFIRLGGFYKFYVLIPYVAGLMSSALCAFDAVKLCIAGEKLNREQYERGALRLGKSALVLLCAAAAGVLGQLVYVIFFRTSSTSLIAELYCIPAFGITAALAWLLLKKAGSAEWVETE